MAKPTRPAPSAVDDLGPQTAVTASMVGVDRNHITNALELQVYARGEDDTPQQIRITVPVDLIPNFMASVVQTGGYVMTDVADAWRRGDCDTCGNLRLVDVTRPNGHKTNTYCPDCTGPEGTRALSGFPSLRTPGRSATRRSDPDT